MAGDSSRQNGKLGGRPKGSFNRPQIRGYFSDEEVREMVEMLKTHMVDDMNLLKFAVEQVFGKAPQQLEVDGIDGEPLEANLSKSDRKQSTASETFSSNSTLTRPRSSRRYTAVFTLCQTPLELFEFSYGHVSEIDGHIGDQVKAFPIFGTFTSWLETKHYSHYLNFRATTGPRYDAEMWFDQYFN